eukprot:11054035-Ditylum_brightwellii.AAC.1
MEMTAYGIGGYKPNCGTSTGMSHVGDGIFYDASYNSSSVNDYNTILEDTEQENDTLVTASEYVQSAPVIDYI